MTIFGALVFVVLFGLWIWLISMPDRPKGR